MKVVRRHICLEENKRLDPRGFHRYDPILVLERPRNDEERPVDNGRVFFFKKWRRNNDVGDARFVFEAQKDKPLGSTWSLPGDDGPGDGYE